MSKFASSVMALSMLAIAGSAVAADALMVAPSFEGNETWLWKKVDDKSGKLLLSSKLVYTGEKEGKHSFTQTDLVKGETSEMLTDGNLGRCRDGICQALLSFPLNPKQQFTYGSFPSVKKDFVEQAECKAVRTEKITVPAGTFKAMKLQCNGTWAQKSTGYQGKTVYNYWYSPEVKSVVRMNWRAYRSDNEKKIWLSTTDELQKYIKS